MSVPLVNGYLVVSPEAPETSYQGPDRSPWGQIDEGYFQGGLPERIRHAYATIRSDPTCGLWWPTCMDLGIAMMLAEYLRGKGRRAETIAIYSPYLAQSPSRVGWSDARFHPLGVDVVAVGEWSLLKALQDVQDPECRSVLRSVNEAGLLRDASEAPVIEARYRGLSENQVVEPIGDSDSGIAVEAVTVYRLRGDHQ